MPPIYIKDQDINDENITPFQICNAVARICGSSKLEGVQKVNNLWMIYTNDKVARLQIASKDSIVFNGKNVQIYDENPYLYRAQVGEDGQIVNNKNDKITIKNIPLSVHNDLIRKLLEDNKLELVTPIKYGCIRDDDGQLTRYKSGDRFVYVKATDTAISRKQKVGEFPCVIIHHGKSHPCLACGMAGHKVGDLQCNARPVQPIYTFRSYEHPLSTQFPCSIIYSDEEYKSVEHAYLCHMARVFGKFDLAKQIQESRHAGEARKLSRRITDEAERFQWEKDNTEFMEELLMIKAEQCERFKSCLMEVKEYIIAETTTNKFWGSGSSKFVTENSTPEYWPGQNVLGALLTDVTQRLLNGEDSETRYRQVSFEHADSDDEPEPELESEPENEIESIPIHEEPKDKPEDIQENETEAETEAGQFKKQEDEQSTLPDAEPDAETITEAESKANDAKQVHSSNSENDSASDRCKPRSMNKPDYSTSKDTQDTQVKYSTQVKDSSTDGRKFHKLTHSSKAEYIRNGNKNNSNSKNKPPAKQNKQNTPRQQDIRRVMDHKRKTLDSTPPEQSGSKVIKTQTQTL